MTLSPTFTVEREVEFQLDVIETQVVILFPIQVHGPQGKNVWLSGI
jgi:hypothetical protein